MWLREVLSFRPTHHAFRISDFGFPARPPRCFGVLLADGAEEAGGIEVFDVALAAVELVDFLGVGVEAEYLEALLSERQGEGQADVAQTNDADEGRLVFDLCQESLSVIFVGHEIRLICWCVVKEKR